MSRFVCRWTGKSYTMTLTLKSVSSPKSIYYLGSLPFFPASFRGLRPLIFCLILNDPQTLPKRPPGTLRIASNTFKGLSRPSSYSTQFLGFHTFPAGYMEHFGHRFRIRGRKLPHIGARMEKTRKTKSNKSKFIFLLPLNPFKGLQRHFDLSLTLFETRNLPKNLKQIQKATPKTF